MVSKPRDKEAKTINRAPGTTPDSRENQLISAAVDRAEQMILNGTASSQIIAHYLKLGSSRERLEQERLRHENELMRVKADALAEQKKMSEMYEEALKAMRSYTGAEPEVEMEEEY